MKISSGGQPRIGTLLPQNFLLHVSNQTSNRLKIDWHFNFYYEKGREEYQRSVLCLRVPKCHIAVSSSCWIWAGNLFRARVLLFLSEVRTFYYLFDILHSTYFICYPRVLRLSDTPIPYFAYLYSMYLPRLPSVVCLPNR